jgi:hypothetical protein
MKRFLMLFALFLTAYVLGAASMLAVYSYRQRDTVVYTTKVPIIAETRSVGPLNAKILVPEGIDLVHDHFMSEGFDTLRLYLNVEPKVLDDCFDRRIDHRPGVVIPYWVKDPND